MFQYQRQDSGSELDRLLLALVVIASAISAVCWILVWFE